MKHLGIIHTTVKTYDSVGAELGRQFGEVQVTNLLDDSLLGEIRAAGEITPKVIERFVSYGLTLKNSGVEILLCACSSLGPVIDLARPILGLPILKIDEPMATEAVAQGEKIAVFGTVATTLGPSSDLIVTKAADAGKTVTVTPFLVTEAFIALNRDNDPAAHDRLLLERIQAVTDDYDVIVLAQASMASLMPKLDGFPKPVLTSMVSGIAQLADYI